VGLWSRQHTPPPLGLLVELRLLPRGLMGLGDLASSRSASIAACAAASALRAASNRSPLASGSAFS